MQKEKLEDLKNLIEELVDLSSGLQDTIRGKNVVRVAGILQNIISTEIESATNIVPQTPLPIRYIPFDIERAKKGEKVVVKGTLDVDHVEVDCHVFENGTVVFLGNNWVNAIRPLNQPRDFSNKFHPIEPDVYHVVTFINKGMADVVTLENEEKANIYALENDGIYNALISYNI